MKSIISVVSLLCVLSIHAQEITINDVQNKIRTGSLVGNRDITFGVKSILEELVQDAGYDLSNNGSILQVDLLYFDVIRKQTQLAVVSKTNNQVEIIASATYKNKTVKAEATADNIITSTIILNNGGSFNQQSVSVALKKLCTKLLDKLKI